LFRHRQRRIRTWQPDWCVIMELVDAGKVTALISQSSSARIELSSQGVLPAGAAPLASASGGLSVAMEKGEVTQIIADSKLTPMFRLSRIRRSMWDHLTGRDDSADFSRVIAAGQVPSPHRVFEPALPEDMGKPAGRGDKTRAASPPRAPVKKRGLTRPKMRPAK
jgi:hypothetical protein